MPTSSPRGDDYGAAAPSHCLRAVSRAVLQRATGDQDRSRSALSAPRFGQVRTPKCGAELANLPMGSHRVSSFTYVPLS